ncbi:hypothetical protein AMS68_001894 [Peltaster fructicola]|uniref:Uncharacterized protein n=1 Tax=Peltaster fructicola TaxID=286661 RepID=A0A6H0XNP3_9PEZI|nr:hypothetical protein AMS68_001894 [Peltaster fructicola]
MNRCSSLFNPEDHRFDNDRESDHSSRVCDSRAKVNSNWCPRRLDSSPVGNGDYGQPLAIGHNSSVFFDNAHGVVGYTARNDMQVSVQQSHGKQAYEGSVFSNDITDEDMALAGYNMCDNANVSHMSCEGRSSTSTSQHMLTMEGIDGHASYSQQAIQDASHHDPFRSSSPDSAAPAFRQLSSWQNRADVLEDESQVGVKPCRAVDSHSKTLDWLDWLDTTMDSSEDAISAGHGPELHVDPAVTSQECECSFGAGSDFQGGLDLANTPSAWSFDTGDMSMAMSSQASPQGSQDHASLTTTMSGGQAEAEAPLSGLFSSARRCERSPASLCFQAHEA